MARIDRRIAARLLARSLTVQGSWNYRTMQGGGLAFALLPFLARIHGADPTRLAESVARHSGFYNGHPYLATVAIAALARMESDGASAEEMERFKRAIVSPLGSLGDQFIWARWRPFCGLLAVFLYVVGAPWWVGVTAFLVLYNGGNIGLRVWGLRIGWREGRAVGRALMSSPLRRLPDRLTIPVIFVGGAALPPLVLSTSGLSRIGPGVVIGIALATVLSLLGLWRPGYAAGVAIIGLVLSSVVLVGTGSPWW